MIKGNIDVWINKLIHSWKEKDVDSIVTMFTCDAICYDTPFSTKGNVKNDWQEIKNQNILDIVYNVLMQKDNEFIVEFIIKYDDEVCSAVNHIKLNQDNKCVYLKQWYMSK